MFAAISPGSVKTSAARPRQPFIPASSAPHEADARRIRDANKWSGQRRVGRRGHSRLPRVSFPKPDISAPFGMRRLAPPPTPHLAKNVEIAIILKPTPIFFMSSSLSLHFFFQEHWPPHGSNPSRYTLVSPKAISSANSVTPLRSGAAPKISLMSQGYGSLMRFTSAFDACTVR